MKPLPHQAYRLATPLIHQDRQTLAGLAVRRLSGHVAARHAPASRSRRAGALLTSSAGRLPGPLPLQLLCRPQGHGVLRPPRRCARSPTRSGDGRSTRPPLAIARDLRSSPSSSTTRAYISSAVPRPRAAAAPPEVGAPAARSPSQALGFEAIGESDAIEIFRHARSRGWRHRAAAPSRRETPAATTALALGAPRGAIPGAPAQADALSRPSHRAIPGTRRPRHARGTPEIPWARRFSPTSSNWISTAGAIPTCAACQMPRRGSISPASALPKAGRDHRWRCARR